MDTNELFNKLLEGQQRIEKRLSTIEDNVQDIKSEQDKNAKRLDSVFNQTAYLSEFRTEINKKLDDITYELDFISQKEHNNEKDIFKLKKKIN